MDELISKRQAIDALCHVDEYNGRSIEAIRQLPPAQLGTNLAQLGTDCISRQAALDALNHELICGAVINQCGLEAAYEVIEDLPPAQPEIIRCRECKFASGDSRICMKFGHSPIGELDFCAWAERRTDEE